MSNFITVVFKHDDDATLPKEISKAFTDNVKYKGCEVVAISLEDEITRVEKPENQQNISNSYEQ